MILNFSVSASSDRPSLYWAYASKAMKHTKGWLTPKSKPLRAVARSGLCGTERTYVLICLPRETLISLNAETQQNSGYNCESYANKHVGFKTIA